MRKPIKKTYVIFGIFALANLFLIACFVWPLLTAIQNNSESLTLIRNATDSLDIQNNQIEDFKKNYDTYDPNLEKMKRVFIDPQNPVDFITFLEGTAGGSGIKIQTSLLPVGLEESKNIITFQVLASDNFLKIINFSKKLENGSHMLTIRKLTIAKILSQNNVDHSGKVDATFIIDALIKQ